MTKLEQHREVWPNKSDEWLFERLANELKDKVETIHKLLTENEQLRTAAVSHRLCDGCNVRDNWEHRCYGEDCRCENPSCMKQQGRITQEELMQIVNKGLNGG